jgi:K(+)-stimulated pyrophosphate-energized sodium pump
MDSKVVGSPHISRTLLGWRFLPGRVTRRLPVTVSTVLLLTLLCGVAAWVCEGDTARSPISSGAWLVLLAALAPACLLRGRLLPRASWRRMSVPLGAALLTLLPAVSAWAQTPGAPEAGGEANLVVPPLNDPHIASFFGQPGSTWLMLGVVVSILGIIFGLVMSSRLRALPVHASMLEVSELIYETCKTYLQTQIKFIGILELFIGAVIVVYFGIFQHYFAEGKIFQVFLILFFSIVGIAGSTAVAWFGIRVNTYANSRAAFAALRGKPFPCYDIPLQAGMSIGMLLISVELLIMLLILLVVPGSLAGPCFIGFAIGESLGASALRIAGGIFTKIADIGADLMKIVFGIKEDDARNPGVIADCTGDNAGDSVGPSADGFETYGVTGVALISFILLAVKNPDGTANLPVQVQLLVWIFVMRIVMMIASALAYAVNGAMAKSKYETVDQFNYEQPLTSLVWITSGISILFTFVISYLLIPHLGGADDLWWKLSLIITCGTLAGAVIPELVKVFTSTESSHVREVVISSREGGASLNILSGLVAGNFSAFWMGMILIVLMGSAWLVSTQGLGALMTVGKVDASPVFAFGLVAFGFLGMGPVTIAVDSYGPVTDNAQSVYELSVIEQIPNIREELKKDYDFDVEFEKAKHHLEENDGAGNTFKATAKPVLIGTAVVGATTMIFSIIVVLTEGLTSVERMGKLSLLHPPFLLGLIAGGSVIYWFTGATIQAVVTGAYRAVEFIKANIKLDGTEKASIADSKKVVEICTLYAQKGMFNIFITVFCATLAFACLESFFFIGYLISIALFGLFQALFMANAGGAWDNAKKIVEVELKEKGTPLHDATVVGDTVGDPFKDTSSVAMNPVIKFTTLFGLLAVELAEQMPQEWRLMAAAVFLVIALVFVYRSFYGMRIRSGDAAVKGGAVKV